MVTREDGTFDAIGRHVQMIQIDPARHLVVAINSAWPLATAKPQSAARMALVNTGAEAIDSERNR